MEGVGRSATVAGGVGQRADGVEELHDRPGPAVAEDHRQGVVVRGTNVQEVDAQPVDLRAAMASAGIWTRNGVMASVAGARVRPAGPAAAAALTARPA